MSLAAAILLALQPVAGEPSGAAAARTAFFCQLAERSATGGADALRPLSVLLAGTADAVAEREPIETFDPTGLLGGGTFTRFLRNPAAGGFAIVTDDSRDASAALLSLVELGGGPELGAGLGFLRDGPDPRFIGRCIRYRSADTAADFHSFNASQGRR